jgi:hypothetical protein
MANKRKTVDIYELILFVNKRNRESICQPEIRKGWNGLLNDILHKANVYSGFGYLIQSEVPEGQLPGIIQSEIGPEFNEYPDPTRCFYYVDSSLIPKEVK